MIILIAVTFWFVASDNDRVAIVNILFYPLQILFVLRFGSLVVPLFVHIGQLLYCLLSIFTN